ncbi:MAG TPA: hypothetical protein VJ302_17755 [Blastocatellia bacterium]|nr:hypothetical protein [Blastocatellia bacterium]
MNRNDSSVGNLIRAAGEKARTLEQQNQGPQAATGDGEQGSVLDVVTNTHQGLASEYHNRSLVENRLKAYVTGMESAVESEGWSNSGAGEVGRAMVDQAKSAAQQAVNLVGAGDQPAPEGALGKVGATFGLLLSLEQVLSSPLSMIPFPALPAVRISDLSFGLPHAHNHPPNLIPPAPPIPFPSIGPVIPIPAFSGAVKTLINGLPAGRCGDLGIGIWCGGYFPLYEIFLGSSNVWIEGARAARLGVDLTKHCIFSVPRPTDPPLGPTVGFPVTASPNVIIGGVPMPSLTSLALGLGTKVVFKGLGKVAKVVRRKLNPNLAVARDLLAKARKAEPRVTSDITRLAKGTGGKMEGLEFRLKSEESLARKLKDTPPNGIRDALRYTIIFDNENLSVNTNRVLDALEREGYEKLKVKNTFRPNERYQGINTSFRSPEGQVFELQMHTPESFNVKQNLTHEVYEELRLLPEDSPRAAELKQQIVDISNDNIPRPPNIDGVKNFP